MDLDPLFDKINDMGVEFLKLLPLFAIAALIIFLTSLCVRVAINIVTRLSARAHLRPSLVSLSITLTRIIAWVFGIMIAMTVIFPSVTPAKLIGALGLGTIAIGFAFQDFFKNLLAGIMIMLRKVMRIGDYIECEGIEGKIEQINIRESYIRQTDGQLVIVPNSKLFENPVFVLTDQETRRYEIIVGVSYDTDLDQAQAIIKAAVEAADLVDHTKKVEVFAREFGESSMNFTLRWWGASKPVDLHESRDSVVRAVKRALDAAGIEIPFPYRTLTFKENIKIAPIESSNPDA